jgi:hypothetical protein
MAAAATRMLAIITKRKSQIKLGPSFFSAIEVGTLVKACRYCLISLIVKSKLNRFSFQFSC